MGFCFDGRAALASPKKRLAVILSLGGETNFFVSSGSGIGIFIYICNCLS